MFDYLHRALQDDDCSPADGVRLMAADGKALAIDIGEAWWQDVDTPEMLARAEQEAARLFRWGRISDASDLLPARHEKNSRTARRAVPTLGYK